MDMESLTINGTVNDLPSQGTATYMNGSYSPTEIIQVNGDATDHDEVTTGTPNDAPIVVESAAPPTYADAFPPLPAGPVPTGTSQSAWGQKSVNKVKQPAVNKPILSSNSTQVFKIPYEERKYKNLSPIVGDAERQNDAILNIMQKNWNNY